MPAYKPDGFHSVTPYLLVRDAAQLLDFVRDAFGGEELGRHAAADGRIMHAVVRIGDTLLEVGEPGPEWSPMPSSLHLYVADADVVYQRAVEAGAESLYEPNDKPYGDREAGIRDPAGNLWFIGTRQARATAADPHAG